MQYAQLAQKHPTFDADRYAMLRDVMSVDGLERNATKYLPWLTGEHIDRLRERRQCAAPVPYGPMLAESYCAGTCARPLAVTADEPLDAEWHEFASDADQCGTPFADLMRSALREAITTGRALVGVDFPVGSSEPFANRAEEEATGAARPYAYVVPVECLIDFERDGHGGFNWAILHCQRETRATPADTRGTVVEEFKVWTLEDGRAVCRRYEIERKRDAEVSDRADVPLVTEHVTSFRRIPLLELSLPPGLALGPLVAPLLLEHFRRRTALVSAQQRSLFAIPYVALGSAFGTPGGAVPSNVAQDETRGIDPRAQLERRGYMLLDANDKIGFAAPDGSCYETVDRQLSALVDEVFRVAGAMSSSVSSTASALARSGVSKSIDRAGQVLVFGSYGQALRALALRVHQTIADARGESIAWSASGCDRHEQYERAELVAEASKLPEIPSATFRAAYRAELASRLLPTMTPEIVAQVTREIIASEYAATQETGPEAS